MDICLLWSHHRHLRTRKTKRAATFRAITPLYLFVNACVRKQISSSHVTLFSFLTCLNLWKSGVHMWKSKFHMISWTFFLFPQVEFLIHIGKCMKKSSSCMTLIPFHMINISLHVRIQIDMWQNIVAHESIHMCNIWSWFRKCSFICEKSQSLVKRK